ncbi:MAG TPA: alpha/beta hydrolase [Polyangiales bacterium]|nr:alpha/beta hydrolase [Polyangiales bacterium]
MLAIQHVTANGVRFAYLEEGRGPLVLLVHGFPDTAHTWDAIRPALAERGYRAVSPFTRGFWPTEAAADGRYDAETLGRDLLALIAALGERDAILVGHDFGATAAYMAASLEAERVRFLATIAVPHPAGLRASPRLVWGMRHFFPLRRKHTAQHVRAENFAYLDRLVHRWSPTWQFSEADMAAVKETFAHPESLDAALAYYRAVSRQLPAPLLQPIAVPSAVFVGREDGTMRPPDYERARRCYAAPHQIIDLPGGHFLHREHPQPFIEALLQVLPRAEPVGLHDVAHADEHLIGGAPNRA